MIGNAGYIIKDSVLFLKEPQIGEKLKPVCGFLLYRKVLFFMFAATFIGKKATFIGKKATFIGKKATFTGTGWC